MRGNRAERQSKRDQNSLLELGTQFTNSHDLCDLGNSFGFHLHDGVLKPLRYVHAAEGSRREPHPIFVDALRVLDYEAHLAVGREERVGQIDADLASDCCVS